jgi:hypothetical protein
MHATVFVTEMSFMMFAILDVIYLHTTITFRSEKQATFIIKTKRSYGILQRGSTRSMAGRVSTKELLRISINPN